MGVCNTQKVDEIHNSFDLPSINFIITLAFFHFLVNLSLQLSFSTKNHLLSIHVDRVQFKNIKWVLYFMNNYWLILGEIRWVEWHTDFPFWTLNTSLALTYNYQGSSVLICNPQKGCKWANNLMFSENLPHIQYFLAVTLENIINHLTKSCDIIFWLAYNKHFQISVKKVTILPVLVFLPQIKII